MAEMVYLKGWLSQMSIWCRVGVYLMNESLVATCKIKLFEQCALCAKWLKITSFVFITYL